LLVSALNLDSLCIVQERRVLLESYLKVCLRWGLCCRCDLIACAAACSQKILSVDKLAKSELLTKFVSSDKVESKEETKVSAALLICSPRYMLIRAVPWLQGEKKKVVDDDAEITGISIPATRSGAVLAIVLLALMLAFLPAIRTMSDHVLYQVDVVNSRKRKTFSKWTGVCSALPLSCSVLARLLAARCSPRVFARPTLTLTLAACLVLLPSSRPPTLVQC
jgi:hypothetical protein